MSTPDYSSLVGRKGEDKIIVETYNLISVVKLRFRKNNKEVSALVFTSDRYAGNS